MYNELDMVFSKIKECERKGEQVPIAELLYCYTVSQRTLEKLKSRSLITTGRYNLQPFPRADSRPHRGSQLHRTVGRDAIFHQGYLDGCPLFLHPLYSGCYAAVDVGVPQWHLCRCDLGESLYIWTLHCRYLQERQFVERLAQTAIKKFDLNKALQKKAYEETIFDRMLCENARREEKGRKPRQLNFRELADEGTGILNAGTEPSAIMLCYATYFFSRFPHVQKPLLDELASVELQDGRLPLRKLEALPYLVSILVLTCIQEKC